MNEYDHYFKELIIIQKKFIIIINLDKGIILKILGFLDYFNQF